MKSYKWLGMIVAVGLIILFIASLITGNKVEDEQAAAKKQQPVPSEADKSVHEYTADKLSKEDNRALIYETTSDETQSAIQDNITKFLDAYVPFNIQEPQSFLETTKKYTTKEFQENLQSEYRRGTLSTVRTKVTNIELYPEQEGRTEQWWSANIKVENTDNKGKESQGLLVYIVKMKLIDGEWKADDLGVRSRAWNQ